MYKWKLDIILKSGVRLECEYDGPEINSGDVILKIFQGKNHTDWVSLFSHKQTHSTFVVVGEIASVDIYERK